MNSSGVDALLPVVVVQRDDAQAFSPPRDAHVFFAPSSPTGDVQPEGPHACITSLVSRCYIDRSAVDSSMSGVIMLSFKGCS